MASTTDMPVGSLLLDSGAAVAPKLFYFAPKNIWVLVSNEWGTAWPFTYLFVLAGLAGIPHELYEAAELDGGGSWAKLRYVVEVGAIELAVYHATDEQI